MVPTPDEARIVDNYQRALTEVALPWPGSTP